MTHEHFGLLSILPALIAITLAVLTKDVILSLALGILSGFVIMYGFDPLLLLTKISDLLVLKLSDAWNLRIILFVILLGSLIGMLSKAGAVAAFGKSSIKVIKKRKNVLLVTWIMGIIMFIDDYFSALSVGSVMRPVSDNHRVSRAKLAYFVHATAPTICVLIPFSSWVVTINSQIKQAEGFKELNVSEFSFFLQMIPYNFYVISTLVLMLVMWLTNRDFKLMKESEEKAYNEGILFNSQKYGACVEHLEEHEDIKAKVYWFDMLIPLLLLICACIVAFPLSYYLDNPNSALSIMEATTQSDSSKALLYGLVFSSSTTYLYFISRGIFTIKIASESFIDGIKSMVPALLILSLAWIIGHTLSKSITDGGVGLPIYLSSILNADFPIAIIPFIAFIFACLIAIATGTSWGTFGIMIPIMLPIVTSLANIQGLPYENILNMSLLTMSAVVSGAIFGDHSSPISDTGILSSTATSCPHLEHIYTQIPYTLMVAVASGLGFLVAGFINNPLIGLSVSLVFMIIMFFTLTKKVKFKDSHYQE